MKKRLEIYKSALSPKFKRTLKNIAIVIFWGQRGSLFIFWIMLPMILVFETILRSRAWNNYDSYLIWIIILSAPYYTILWLIIKWILKDLETINKKNKLMGLFSFLRPKTYKYLNPTKGCLFGKTEEMKIDFFKSLANFAITDEMFFKEQYNDLLPHEKKEFEDYVHKTNSELKQIRLMVDVLTELLDDKNKS